MFQFRFSLVLGLVTLFFTPGYGAIKRLDDPNAFSGASVTIDFEWHGQICDGSGLRIRGPGAGTVFVIWIVDRGS